MENILYLEKSWKKYEGTFKESKKEGIGCLYFENGDNFLGEFANDQVNGLGIFNMKEGDKILG